MQTFIRRNSYLKNFLSIIFIFVISAASLVAQNSVIKDKNKIEELKKQSERLVKYFEKTLNILGSKNFSRKEKDIIINESYSKIFKSDEVQIEDDLAENRLVVTNKNVQDYLKDVVFFFKNVRFKFNTDEISHFYNSDSLLIFKVAVSRILTGISLESKAVNFDMKRYFEINYNDSEKELKIASIYTTRLNEDDDLKNSWQNMPQVWKNYFKKSINKEGTITIEDIKKIIKTREVDISGNKNITDVSPLSMFRNIRNLNISNSGVKTLTPIRNLTKFEKLNVENTNIDDISFIRYSKNISELKIGNTKIKNIEVLSIYKNLKTLDCRNTEISDFSPLKELNKLETINAASTKIITINFVNNLNKLKNLNFENAFTLNNISPLSKLKNLEKLVLNKTSVKDLSPLSLLDNLTELHINYTPVSELNALFGNKKLKKVYCDNSLITKKHAEKFIEKKPNCLIIYESEELQKWWAGLSDEWKSILSKHAKVNKNPDKESIHKISNLKKIDITGNSKIKSLDALIKLNKIKILNCSKTNIDKINILSKLKNLELLNISGTKVSDISPISEAYNLKKADFSNTQISDISALRNLINLKELNINNTQVSNLQPVFLLKNINEIYADNSLIKNKEADGFLIQNKKTLLIYQTEELENWWGNLDDNWKNIFKKNLNLSKIPNKISLQKIVLLEKIEPVNNPEFENLDPLKKLKYLKEIIINNAQNGNINAISGLKLLEVFHYTKSPLFDLAPLQNLSNLQELNISDTPVEETEALLKLYNLKVFNCSGTKIRKLNDIEYLSKLIKINCSSTLIRNINPLKAIKGLQTLKCYNTKVSSRKIESFKETMPNCKVVYY